MGRNAKFAAGLAVAAAVVAVAWTTVRPDAATASPASAAPTKRAPDSSPQHAASDLSSAPAKTTAASPRLPVKKSDRSPATGCAVRERNDETCSFLEPGDETMQEMARCGIARLEVPRMPQAASGIDAFPAAWRESAGVTEAEHAQLEQAAAAFAKRTREQWAELALTAGIDKAWAETSEPVVVSTRIFASFDEDQYAQAVDRVARERAGWAPLEADVPDLLDAAVRLRLSAGSAYEAALAEVVGDARAAELHAAADGWPGTNGSMGNLCDVEPVPPRPRDFVPSDATQAEACIHDAKGKACAFLEPTKLELERMADCGVVRFDAPGFLGARFSEPTFDFDDDWANAVELTSTEAAALAEVGDAFRDALYEDLTKLALEAGKSQEWADQTPFLGMMIAISEGSGSTREDTEAMFRRLAEERAQRTAPPADLATRSIDERFMRRVIELGEDFEQAIAKRLGAQRAGALRTADDGWPGLRLQTQNYCDHSQPQTF